MVRLKKKKLLVALVSSCCAALMMMMMMKYYSPDDCPTEILGRQQSHLIVGDEYKNVDLPKTHKSKSAMISNPIQPNKSQLHTLEVKTTEAAKQKTHNVGLNVSTMRMEERRLYVASECLKLPQQSPKVNLALYNSKYKFYYCPVEKVGTTFWRRFSYQLNKTDPVRSPFDVPIREGVLGTMPLHLSKEQREGKALKKILGESTKLLFVRDPFSRILSAYVDKLLAPNPTFSKRWALPAMLLYRPNHLVDRSSDCSYDVTFEEFVNYVIDDLHKKDLHTIPISRMCSPCAVAYTVIGKMESFMDDASLLFDYLHLNTSRLRMQTIKQETIQDAISDSGTDALSLKWLSSSLKCITKETVLQKVWRKTQIRGLVSWREKMKLSSAKIRSMTSEAFVKHLTAAHRRSKDKDELKVQKLQAMKEAYFKLSIGLLNRFRRVYRDDFKIFGYDEYPAWLKISEINGSFIDTHAFDYSQNWDLSHVLIAKT